MGVIRGLPPSPSTVRQRRTRKPSLRAIPNASMAASQAPAVTATVPLIQSRRAALQVVACEVGWRSGRRRWLRPPRRDPAGGVAQDTMNRTTANDDARASDEFRAVLVKERGYRARSAAGDLLEGVCRVV